MSIETFAEQEKPRLGARLTGMYCRFFAAYLIAMILMWIVGVESLFYHATPFYALYDPIIATRPEAAVLAVLLWLVYLAFATAFPALRATGAPPKGWVFASWALCAAAASAWFAVTAWDAHTDATEMAAAIWDAFRWHGLAIFVFAAFLGLLLTFLPRLFPAFGAPEGRGLAWILLGVMVFSFLFAGSIAMIRGGPDGIAHAYERRDSEFIGDIGLGGGIRGLFRDYEDIHGQLSMHGKVHPPGPTVLLWLMSYVTLSREPLPLSLATMAFGVLAIIPLYFFARDLAGHRAALTACLMYALMPSIVLFTATSANILFMPFVLTTLFLFWRALHHCSMIYAVGAGVGYAFMSLLSFGLIGVGAFFGIVGLWRLKDRLLRFSVFQTAVIMLLAFLGVHLAVRWWSGFDMFAAFGLALAQFNLDQAQLEQLTPRYPGYAWRFFNPLAWVYFAGIPVSLLLFWRLFKPEPATKALFLVFALTLLALNFLYLGRGEGERSAMYILPFAVIPAAHALNRLCEAGESRAPLVATLGFLAFQCWFTESYFYTYW